MYQLLKEIADVGAGQGAPQDGRAFGKIGMPFIRAGNLVELLMGKDIEEIQKIAEDTARKYKLKVYPKGTVLFAKSGMSCLKGYVYVLPCNAYVVNHLACIVPREDFSLYLRYYFNYHKPNQLVKDEAYPSISLSDIGNLKIDVKSKEQREHIVKILNTIKDIITIRKKEIEILDTLVNARFVEMFGEYPSNDKKWETCTVGNVVSEVRYGSSRPAVEDGRYPYLRMNNITYSGYLDLNDVKRIDIPDNEVEKCSLRRGDVLFNRTNSKELVGKTCVYNRDEMMILAGFVIRIRMGDRMLPEFLSQFLNTDFSKRMLLNMCRAAIGQANINAQELKNIGIYLPPIDRQKEFVVFREKIDKSKLAVQKSLEEAQLLFDSLMQEYFG